MIVTSPMRIPSAVAASVCAVRGREPEPQPVAMFDTDFSRTWAAFGAEAARKRLHALHPARPGDETAATALAIALLVRLSHLGPHHQSARPILWITCRSMHREAGRPYGAGLARLGVAPERIVILAASNFEEVRAAAEMGLEIGALEGVLMELPPTISADMLTLGKRLALRAERTSTPAFLLHANIEAPAAPVATRWQIASYSSADARAPWEAGTTVAALTLVKNRFGPTGQWIAPLAPAPHLRAPRIPIASVLSSQQRGRDVVTRSPSPSFEPPNLEPLAPLSAGRSHSPPRDGGTA